MKALSCGRIPFASVPLPASGVRILTAIDLLTDSLVSSRHDQLQLHVQSDNGLDKGNRRGINRSFGTNRSQKSETWEVWALGQ